MIQSEAESYGELESLLGGYLHQDFVHEYGSPRAAVEAYRRDGSAADARLAAEQSASLRAAVADDDELARAMARMGMDYYPRGDGWLEHAWLRQLESWLREEAQDDGPGIGVEHFDRDAEHWGPLRHLFGAYLNQDFNEDYGDPWAAVEAFRVESSPDSVRQAGSTARALAKEIHDEADGRAVVEAMKLDYNPTYDGYTVHDWLIALADFLEADESRAPRAG